MRDFKATELISCLRPLRLLLPDESSNLRLTDGLQECLQLLPGSFGHQLDPAIFEVADRPGDLKAMREGSDRITEPDTLHMP